MIKKESLRIGNLVIYKPYGNKDGEMKTIQGMLGMKAFFDKHSNESGMFFNLEGIPLTPEILEKCGFKKANSIVWAREDDFCISDYYDEKDMRVKGKYCLNFMTISHDEEISFEYVHQLQNLYFALCGQELQIKL